MKIQYKLEYLQLIAYHVKRKSHIYLLRSVSNNTTNSTFHTTLIKFLIIKLSINNLFLKIKIILKKYSLHTPT